MCKGFRVYLIISQLVFLVLVKNKAKDIELKGHTDSVDQLCWDPKHADLLATASGDKTVRLWDARSESKLLVLISLVLFILGSYVHTGFFSTLFLLAVRLPVDSLSSGVSEAFLCICVIVYGTAMGIAGCTPIPAIVV